MLVIKTREGVIIKLADQQIRIELLQWKGSPIKLGITAPDHVQIERAELEKRRAA